MQQCTMNDDTFRRDDDGRLFLNGNEIIKYHVGVGYSLWIPMLLSFAVGYMVGILV